MRDPTLPVTATNPAAGRRIRLSVARRMVADYMWASSGIAQVGVTRPVELGDVIAARRGMQNPPSWTAIFAKAFAMVAAEVPELRRVYMKWPWPHLYEYAESTVSIMQERRIMGDTGLLPMRFRRPDTLPIGAFSDMIRGAAETPIEFIEILSQSGRGHAMAGVHPPPDLGPVLVHPPAAPAHARNLCGLIGRTMAGRAWPDAIADPLPVELRAGGCGGPGAGPVEFRPPHLRRRGCRPRSDAPGRGVELFDPRRVARSWRAATIRPATPRLKENPCENSCRHPLPRSS